MTPARLANIAAFYLERFSASESHLRAVLTRRIRRDLTRRDELTPARLAEAVSWLETEIAKLKRNGLVDDVAYAQGRAARDRRLAKAPTRTRAALRAKGVAATVAADATRDETGEAEWAAAVALARRRRLGPYRKTDRDADSDRRDLAALARGGIGFATAKRLMALTEPPA
ncbi:MAG: RecX family transcriptional regulator [Rhodospirillaceae bacterium]|nr:RecX family transcriptional regulator [Rhodospirillaceae bacterium]